MRDLGFLDLAAIGARLGIGADRRRATYRRSPSLDARPTLP